MMVMGSALIFSASRARGSSCTAMWTPYSTYRSTSLVRVTEQRHRDVPTHELGLAYCMSVGGLGLRRHRTKRRATCALNAS